MARPIRVASPHIRLEEPGRDLRQRRLAAAVQPFEGDDLAAVDAERDPTEHLGPVAVRIVDGIEPDHRRAAPRCAEVDRAGRARRRSEGVTSRARRAPPRRARRGRCDPPPSSPPDRQSQARGRRVARRGRRHSAPARPRRGTPRHRRRRAGTSARRAAGAAVAAPAPRRGRRAAAPRPRARPCAGS